MTPDDLDELLAASPLPSIGGDKADRGNALIVAGDPTCPGAAILAGTAALRAGAGRAQLITHPDIATAIGIALPEAFVIGWDGHGDPSTEIRELASDAAAVLIGPGLDRRATETARKLAALIPTDTPLFLDAGSLTAAPDLVGRRLIALPNTDEADDLARQLDLEHADQPILAAALANQLSGVVAVRGAITVLSDGRHSWQTGGHPALGTAGSGDVLAGLVTGLAARNLDPLIAAAWAIAIHSQAATHVGGADPRGAYLASDLLDVIGGAIDQVTAHLHSTTRTARRDT